jgi:hypothetical protein
MTDPTAFKVVITYYPGPPNNVWNFISVPMGEDEAKKIVERATVVSPGWIPIPTNDGIEYIPPSMVLNSVIKIIEA